MTKLSNPKAMPAAQAVYDYILSLKGKKVLSGQQESDWKAGPEYEMEFIREHTGNYPAIRGLDYINNDFDGVTKRSMEWWKRGGLVSTCWHWGIPPQGVGYESSKETIDIEEALTPGTALHQGMLDRMDEVAVELAKLRDAGVPVLWRPFHEFDGSPEGGAWFWWGKSGADCFVRLWRLMYQRYTEQFNLTNLIWVLGYADSVQDGWYPGDAYVDITGADTYRMGLHKNAYERCAALSMKDMPIAYHECGDIPNPADMLAAGLGWAWFLTWHTQWLEANSPEHLRLVYNGGKTVNLGDLPKFS